MNILNLDGGRVFGAAGCGGGASVSRARAAISNISDVVVSSGTGTGFFIYRRDGELTGEGDAGAGARGSGEE